MNALLIRILEETRRKTSDRMSAASTEWFKFQAAVQPVPDALQHEVNTLGYDYKCLGWFLANLPEDWTNRMDMDELAANLKKAEIAEQKYGGKAIEGYEIDWRAFEKLRKRTLKWTIRVAFAEAAMARAK